MYNDPRFPNYALNSARLHLFQQADARRGERAERREVEEMSTEGKLCRTCA